MTSWWVVVLIFLCLGLVLAFGLLPPPSAAELDAERRRILDTFERNTHAAIDEFNAAEERRYLARDRKLQELEGMLRAARVELDEIEAEVRARPQDQDHGGTSG